MEQASKTEPQSMKRFLPSGLGSRTLRRILPNRHLPAADRAARRVKAFDGGAPLQPFLPEGDPAPEQRARQLEEFRKEYFFNTNYIPGYPFLDHVPPREQFSPYYWAGRLASLASLPLNQIASAVRTTLFEPIRRLPDFDRLFAVYEKPEQIANWLSDESFNEQRLSGCNPQAIVRLDQITAGGFPFSDTHLQALLGPGRRLDAECEQRRLYYVDYEALAHIQGSPWNGGTRTTPSPRALFWWDADALRLQCVGIQIRRGPDARVFLPGDPPLDWLAAKIAFQCADACHQELGTHFAWTHMVMAPVAVVTRRQLALQHPVHLLLMPHFQFYLFDNELGRTDFINPGGPVERMFGGTLAESLGIPLNLYKQWRILDSAPDREIARRKLDDPRLLPHYPYRDDGLLVWRAIREFVASYLALYYPNDEAVAADPELQAWATELASPEGGRVAGMPERIDSVAQLTELLAVVMWTCGPLHSMLNFAQWDYINVPNMSYAIYREVPEAVGGVDYEVLMQIMPPRRQAAFQMWWCKILTSYRYNRLGQYDQGFADPRAQLTLQIFQQSLSAVEREIEARDRTRRVSFPYFKPSLCINSINT